MTIAGAERYKLEQQIFSCRTEAGLQKMREWLYDRRDGLNNKWPDLVGDDLASAQGEARAVNKMIKMLDQGPTIKEATNV
jgi:hypothetical protein